MADDNSKTRPQDAQRININEDYGLRRWSEKFGATQQQLKASVRAIGVMADDVARRLGNQSGRSSCRRAQLVA